MATQNSSLSHSQFFTDDSSQTLIFSFILAVPKSSNSSICHSQYYISIGSAEASKAAGSWPYLRNVTLTSYPQFLLVRTVFRTTQRVFIETDKAALHPLMHPREGEGGDGYTHMHVSLEAVQKWQFSLITQSRKHLIFFFFFFFFSLQRADRI